VPEWGDIENGIMPHKELLGRLKEEVQNSYPHPEQLLCKFMVEWLRLWLYAHRLAMDHLVVFLILVLLLPGIVLDTLNDMCNDSFNFHNLLVYRDFHVKKRELRSARPCNPVRTTELHNTGDAWDPNEFR